MALERNNSRFVFCFLAAMLFMSNASLAQTETLACDYPRWSDSEGAHKTKGEMKMTFLIDRETDKAYLVGNNGSNEVSIVEAGRQVTFVEVTGSGNVMTTTVSPDMKSVHSRHSVVFDDLTPSQYYGHCERK